MKAIKPAMGAYVIALFAAGIVGFGLARTVGKNLQVAPRAADAVEGRLHGHFKNVTRLPDGRIGTTAAGGNWRDAVLAASGWNARARHRVLLPGGSDDAAWALPGAYWAAYYGAPVTFAADGDPVPAPPGELPVFAIGSDAFFADVRKRQARVRGISAGSPAELAVALAEFRDHDAEFGWGRKRSLRDGYFHFVLTTPGEAELAYRSLSLATTNAATVLFGSDAGGLPGSTDRYLWQQRTDWFQTPSEGPFRHIFVVGERLSYGAQARADLALEKSAYASLGDVALGGIEALLGSLVLLGVAGGVLVWVHAWRLLPEISPMMRTAWTGTAALAPVLGPLLYFASYRHGSMEHGGMRRWRRPPSLTAASATAMGFGLAAPLMVTVGWLYLYFGFPLGYGPGWDHAFFWLGAGMPRMMIGMYVLPVLLAWPLAQAPMREHMHPHMPRRRVWMQALWVTAISMAAVSLGMMTMTWWTLMNHLPMMPDDDEFRWFGMLWLASLLGFLVAWPLNTPLVRRGLKPGTM